MLIVLSKAPSLDGYESILKIAEKAREKGENVAVLHIQDACTAVTMQKHCKILAESRIHAYVLRADCEARGLLRKIGRAIKIVDYKGWAKLVMNDHNKIVSWTT